MTKYVLMYKNLTNVESEKVSLISIDGFVEKQVLREIAIIFIFLTLQKLTDETNVHFMSVNTRL